MNSLLKIAISLLLLVFPINSRSNPIVIDYSEADVIKSSENLSIMVGEWGSRIVGEFAYRRIPNFSKEKEEHYTPEYFMIIVPIYRAKKTKKIDDPPAYDPKLTIEAGGKQYEAIEVYVADGEAPNRFGPILDWIESRKYELAFFVVEMPVKLLDNSEKIRIEYTQEHIREGRKKYLLYTPYFENYPVWKAVEKDHTDFQIHISANDSVIMAIKPTGNEFNYQGVVEGKHVVWPEHLKTIKIRITKR